MSREDTIINSVIFERASVCNTRVRQIAYSNEGKAINFYGRRMLRAADKKRIKPTDSDQQIAAAITPIMAWLFWQIAPELLLWIVSAIRKRIWTQESNGDR